MYTPYIVLNTQCSIHTLSHAIAGSGKVSLSAEVGGLFPSVHAPYLPLGH